MKDFLDKYLDKYISIVVIVAIIVVVNRVLDELINRTIRRKRKKNVTTLLMFIKRIKKLILYSLMVLLCLEQFDAFHKFSITVLSGLGIGSVVLGLAAQESMKNFFGSLALVIGDAYEVGDFIECSMQGVSGTVEDITMRHTIIRTINNRRVIIPNCQMNSYIIENFNYKDNENVKLVDYSISYEADIDKAISILKDEMKKLYKPSKKGINKDVEFPKVRVASWNDSSISLRAWVWGKDNSDVYDNMYKLNYVIKKRFDEENIEIPYPHVVVTKK
mgnify:FL=1|jgi:probable mechanosensitive channel